MKLYLVRHGDAVDAHRDPERPLSLHGAKDVEKIAAFLKRAEVRVDTIYHSTKKRAEQTAEIIQKATNPSAELIKKDNISPEDPISQLYAELCERTEDLMVVSHLPFLPRLISKLVLGNENKAVIGLSTACVVAMYREPNNNWQIVWVVNPQLI